MLDRSRFTRRGLLAASLAAVAVPLAGRAERAGAAVTVGTPGREVLTGPRSYFVNPSGSDTNDGLTRGSAFRTVQRAIDAAAGVDNAGFSIVINLAPGSYVTATGNELKPYVGAGEVLIQGDPADPSAAQVITSGPGLARCFWAVSMGRIYTVKALTVASTAGQGETIGLYCNGAGRIIFDRLRFGPQVYAHMVARFGGVVCGLDYEIAGGARHHWIATNGGAVWVQNRTVTLTGQPSFAYFAYADLMGQIDAAGNTFAGAARGSRFLCQWNSLIYVGTADPNIYLPGDTPGVSRQGGVCAHNPSPTALATGVDTP